MCPCHPEDNQITLALLAAAGVLLLMGILRRFWPTMTTGLRVTVVAAGFVALVCAAFALNRGGDPPETCPHHPPAAASLEKMTTFRNGEADPAPLSAYPAEESIAVQPSEPRVIAYYFHRTLRCPACLEIEELSRQIIETVFAPEISGGRLGWREVDIEETGNKHFVEEFDLTEPSLVLTRRVAGRPVDWKILDATWDHLDTPAALQQYVQTELELFMYSDPFGDP